MKLQQSISTQIDVEISKSLLQGQQLRKEMDEVELQSELIRSAH